jgi:hypothetical protein
MGGKKEKQDRSEKGQYEDLGHNQSELCRHSQAKCCFVYTKLGQRLSNALEKNG